MTNIVAGLLLVIAVSALLWHVSAEQHSIQADWQERTSEFGVLGM